MSKISNQLLSGSTMRGMSLGLNILVGFFLMPFVIHNLGDRMYGFWTLIGTFLGYYGLIDFGLTSAVNRYIAGAIGKGDKETCNDVFNTALILFTVLGGIILVLTLIIAAVAGFFWERPEDITLFRQVMFILGVNTAINFPARVFRGVLTSQLRFDIISSIQVFTLLLRSALVVIVLKLGYGILAMAIVSFIVNIPDTGFLIVYAFKKLSFLEFNHRHCKADTAKMLFSYSSITFISQIADQMRFNLDSLVITAFINLNAVTHYKIASELMHYFISFMISFMGVFQPVFSRLDGENKQAAIHSTFFFATKLSIYISAFMAFGLICWGNSFIIRWVGPEYQDAFPCLVLLVAGGVCALSQMPTVNLLYGISKHRFFALFNSLEAICNLLLSILLAPKYGIVGVAFGTFLPMVIVKLAIQPVYVCRTCSISYKAYLAHCAKAICCVIVALLFPILASVYFVGPDYGRLVMIGIGSLCIYATLILKIGFAENEKALFPQNKILQLILGRSKCIDT